MTWTSKPKIDARAVARAMCEAAEQRRLVAEAVPLPEPDDAMLPLEWHDGRIKLWRRSAAWRGWMDAEAWVDWMDEDWWHAGVILGAWVLVMFAATVGVVRIVGELWR